MTTSLTLTLSEDTLNALADAVAVRVAEQLARRDGSGRLDGFLNPEGAASYLGVSRRRIHDLKSMGALEPDGCDGRTPLFTRETLDAYARSRLVAP